MNRLDEIEARTRAASEGPWFDEERNLDAPWDLTTVYYGFHNGETPDRDLVAEAAYDNAEFIAHARTDVPALVAVARYALSQHSKDEAHNECGHCADSYGEDGWPCSTVREIHRLLGEDA